MLALLIVHDHQIRQPMDALKNNSHRSGGQKSRRRLGSGDATPDDYLQSFRRAAQHLFDRRIETQGRLATHKSSGLAAFDYDSPDAGIFLGHGGQQRNVADDGKAVVVFRQEPQSLQQG